MNVPGSGMTSRGRGSLLIAGGVIAGLGLLIPGLYGVSFSPPSASLRRAFDEILADAGTDVIGS